MTRSSRPPKWRECSRSEFESLAHHSHAQPLAIEGQKKGGRPIFSSPRLLDFGNLGGDLDGPNVAGLVWVPEFRGGLSDFSDQFFPGRTDSRSSAVPRTMAWAKLGDFGMGVKILLITCVCLSLGNVFAQSSEKEPTAIVELGGAAFHGRTGEGASFGPTIAVEVTPIEKWLELEAGVTSLFRGHSTEWSADLLFKKPWTLSKRAEFMVGLGPEWIHARQYSTTTNSLGGEVVADFMYWPSSAKHRFGWYVEPGYEYNFGRGHEQSLGVSGGLLIAIP
jgi:hypothetical protein